MKDRYDMLNQAAHPLAGATMTGADMLVQVLADEGVDTIFGYSGGAILPIYDAVFRYNQEHQSAMPLIESRIDTASSEACPEKAQP